MSPLPEVLNGSVKSLYNIGVVSRMTGISMATLRAWERRYDFPETDRTSGGHRLYSERDVNRLQWVKARIEEGMQTAQAIQALRHQEQNARLVHTPPVESQPMERKPVVISPHLSKAEDRLVDALLDQDLSKADLVLGEALASSTPEDVILSVIAPALHEIGTRWEEGVINVADEHLSSNYLRQRLLMWMVSGPPHYDMNPILLACGPNEWHEGSLLILGALLRRRRFPVAYLGQNLPLPDLFSLAQQIHSPLVVLAAMTEAAAQALVGWPEAVRVIANSTQPIVGFGGRIFSIKPEWRTKIPGIYLGDTLQQGLERIEQLVSG